ncbi:glycosyltransferase [Vogesella urethralis]|uniref:glycosyltransferase n=1 Tax=Vogesella urethralis TaxID=2592656 RepID=UPI0011855C3D|nr:glycosyltransferase [Vogesella urethralis]
MQSESCATIAFVLISYNQRQFIEEALEGIRTQERTPDEVVIADDGSTDGTQDIILDYVARHSLSEQWKLLLSPINRGINTNLQCGIEASSADIIIAVAGDDVSLPNRAAVTELLFASNPGKLMISTSGYVINEHGIIRKEINYPDDLLDNVALAIKRGNPLIMPIGHAMRRSIFLDFGALPPDLPNEDDQTTFRGLASGGIVRSSIKTFKYRVHDNSASAWLHRNTSIDEYFARFKKDMLVRHNHMKCWVSVLECIDPVKHADSIYSLSIKSSFYLMMASIDRVGFLARFYGLVRFFRIISAKEVVYLIGGKSSVIFWRFLRRVTGRMN